MRIKLEINCKEHFHVLDWKNVPFEIQNEWYQGKCNIRTYNINELLGTKLRALYRCTKGRDLFDLDYARRKEDVNSLKMASGLHHVYTRTKKKGVRFL